MSDQFTFTAEVWLWQGDSPWHFVSLPEHVADEIEALSSGRSGGFGSVPVLVCSGDVTWQTSLFPDRKSGTYLLPLKKQVRMQLGCVEGTDLTVSIRPLLD